MIRTFMAVLLAMAAGNATMLTWHQLIASADMDPAVQVSRSRASALKNGAPTRLWDEVRLSYKMDGLDGSEHDFGLRVSPLDPWGYGAWSDYWKAQAGVQGARADRIRAEAVQERLEAGVEWLYRSRLLELERELGIVYQDRVQVHLGLAGSERFDGEDLVVSREKAVDQGAAILEATADLAQAREDLQDLVGLVDSIALDTSVFPDPEELLRMVDSLPGHPDSLFPGWRESEQRLDLAQKGLALARSDGRRAVDYIEAGWQLDVPDPGKKDKTKGLEDWSLGIGIRIPIADGSGGNELKRSIDVEEEQVAQAQKRRQLQQKLDEVKARMNALVEQWRVHKSFVGQVDAGQLFTDFAAQANSDPLLLLRARESALQTERRAVRLRFETTKLWIQLLSLTGRMDMVHHFQHGAEG